MGTRPPPGPSPPASAAEVYDGRYSAAQAELTRNGGSALVALCLEAQGQPPQIVARAAQAITALTLCNGARGAGRGAWAALGLTLACACAEATQAALAEAGCIELLAAQLRSSRGHEAAVCECVKATLVLVSRCGEWEWGRPSGD